MGEGEKEGRRSEDTEEKTIYGRKGEGGIIGKKRKIEKNKSKKNGRQEERNKEEIRNWGGIKETERGENKRRERGMR